MSGLRRIVAEFDYLPEGGRVVNPRDFTMNGKGEIVFRAALLGSASYPRYGLLGSLPASGLERVVLSGDSAPGGGTFSGFSGPQLNNQTQVAFYADTSDPSGSGIFIASRATASIQAVARSAGVWPGPGGGTIASFNTSILLNDNSQVAFFAGRSGSGAGLFVGTAGVTPLIKKVVELGDSAPNGTITGIQTPFKLNAAGQVAYVATYPSGVPGLFGSAVFLGTGGTTPQVVAKSGSPAPGTGGKYLGSFRSDSIDLNSSGQVVFWNLVKDSPYGILNGWFLGSTTAASPRLLHQQPLPGGGQASQVSPGNRSVALADSGEMVIYVADVADGIQPRFVIAGANGALRKFATSGENAEGTGSEFGKLYVPLVATPSGRLLFGAMLVHGPAKAGVFQDGRP